MIPASQRGHGRASDDQVSPVGATDEQLLPISASVALSRVAGLAAARWEGEQEHLTTEAMRLSPNGLSQRPAEEALAGSCTLEEALAAEGSATAANAAHAELSARDDVSGTHLASNQDHGPPYDRVPSRTRRKSGASKDLLVFCTRRIKTKASLCRTLPIV